VNPKKKFLWGMREASQEGELKVGWPFFLGDRLSCSASGPDAALSFSTTRSGRRHATTEIENQRWATWACRCRNGCWFSRMKAQVKVETTVGTSTGMWIETIKSFLVSRLD
jgi:hypothetical protein